VASRLDTEVSREVREYTTPVPHEGQLRAFPQPNKYTPNWVFKKNKAFSNYPHDMVLETQHTTNVRNDRSKLFFIYPNCDDIYRLPIKLSHSAVFIHKTERKIVFVTDAFRKQSPKLENIHPLHKVYKLVL